MCFLRFPGLVLGENERPPDRLLNLVARRLGVSILAWDIYAQRDETRREHLIELLSYLGMEQFGGITPARPVIILGCSGWSDGGFRTSSGLFAAF